MLIATDQQVLLHSTKDIDVVPAPLLSTDAAAIIDMTPALAAAWVGGGDVVLGRGGELGRLNTGLEEKVTSLHILCEEPLVLLAGTEPARLFRITGDGLVEPLEGFDRVEGRDSWDTPWGGPAAVRSIASHGKWLYVDIHVGGIVRSGDNGETWSPVQDAIHRDVHQVLTHSGRPERIYANTAQGPYMSEDRGDSWSHAVVGLATRYGRAIAVDSEDPDLMLASVSLGSHQGEGRLYRSTDAGTSWRHVSRGFPPFVEGNIDTFCLAFGGVDRAWAAVDRTLYRSDDLGESWTEAWEAEVPIRALAAPRS
ncbi:MAG: hypothetical protein HN712_12490 [Gemmatimonadetes bacterium]|jgi:photosystem II stability/assembly factor-like uncharacterized protein|nr:hypothetical protein [Gemmatimonadota bacterium]MBT6148601.1 hypothetical protein [Gemmatimonadota bacterium]MBT7861130.1 hypothetical protein [Gemmatimonadota bacterium]